MPACIDVPLPFFAKRVWARIEYFTADTRYSISSAQITSGSCTDRLSMDIIGKFLMENLVIWRL
jgi:hypothetical protein